MPESMLPPLPDSFYEHEFHFCLGSDVDVRMLIFSMHEQTRIYSHRYTRGNEDGRTVDAVNDLKLVVPYRHGRVDGTITLSMHIILPHRLGQEYLYGADISPGAKTYIEFDYLRVDPTAVLGEWRLDEVRVGAFKKFRFDQGPGLFKPVEFPFPVLDRVKPQGRMLEFPVLLEEPGKVGYIEVPIVTIRNWHPPKTPPEGLPQ